MTVAPREPDVPSDAGPSDAPSGTGQDVVSADPDPVLVTDVFARGCTSRAAFEGVTSRWASLALLALGEGGYRFNALRRRVDGVSEKMLSQTLQALERDGMVVRHVVTTIPPRVEYTLTPLGERVAGSLRTLADLLEASTGDVAAARSAYARTREPGHQR